MALNEVFVDNVTLLASAARTTTGTGTAVELPSLARRFAFQIVCSARSGTTPTLDATVQHSIDGGTTWFTLVTFTQLTNTGSELKAYADVEGTTAQFVGRLFRVSYTIGGTTPSFTFGVTAAAQG